jgi:hypothetical protein
MHGNTPRCPSKKRVGEQMEHEEVVHELHQRKVEAINLNPHPVFMVLCNC